MAGFLKRLFGFPDDSGSAADAEAEGPVGPVHENPELAVVEGATVSDPSRPAEGKGWIGVDLDGTLAFYDGWMGFEHIGDPIPSMVLRVREWLAQGYEVRIFTARASTPEGIQPVKDWLKKHELPDLQVTCSKDFSMVEVWDDRAIQVVANSGQPVLSARFGALPRAPLIGIEHRQAEAAAMEQRIRDDK